MLTVHSESCNMLHGLKIVGYTSSQRRVLDQNCFKVKLKKTATLGTAELMEQLADAERERDLSPLPFPPKFQSLSCTHCTLPHSDLMQSSSRKPLTSLLTRYLPGELNWLTKAHWLTTAEAGTRQSAILSPPSFRGSRLLYRHLQSSRSAASTTFNALFIPWCEHQTNHEAVSKKQKEIM